jgi:hypothetical protein
MTQDEFEVSAPVGGKANLGRAHNREWTNLRVADS